MLASSLHVIREAGHFDSYERLLAPEHRDAVIYALAMSWIPVEIANAHYRACDALALDDAELARIGTMVAARYADTIFGTILRTSRQVGIEAPWMALRAQARIWDRVYVGGSICIYRTGLKDGISEIKGLPLLEFRYFRATYMAWFKAIGDLLVKKLYLRVQRSKEPHPHTITVAGSWV